MTTHYSILAWEIAWAEEPDRLRSTGLQSWTRLSDSSHMHTCIGLVKYPLGFFQKIVWENLNKLFGQPNTYYNQSYEVVYFPSEKSKAQ